MLALLVAALLVQAPPLKPCLVQSVHARCGSVSVAENRAFPSRRTIRLRVVVLPSLRKPAAPDAFTFVTGGPGGAATELTSFVADRFRRIQQTRDIVLVDQRGTGGSNRLECPPPKAVRTKEDARRYVDSCLRSLHGDPMQYGTRAAVDDLESLRRALGYRQLDVYGASYGATVAQMYLARYPRSTRTVVLDGATAVDVPFFGRFATNAQRALADVAARCSADRYCTKAFPGWTATFTRLVRLWNKRPAQTADGQKTTGVGLAGLVQNMLITADTAASVPLVVTQAAAGNFEPLNRFVQPPSTMPVMYWSVMCNEPWVGLAAKGPWHTDFDGFAVASIAEKRLTCSFLPKRPEPAAAWKLPRSSAPLLALIGGADPQDPISNLPNLKQRYPSSRAIVVPHYGHTVVQYGCLGDLVARFVAARSSARLATGCVKDILPPGFTYSL